MGMGYVAASMITAVAGRVVWELVLLGFAYQDAAATTEAWNDKEPVPALLLGVLAPHKKNRSLPPSAGGRRWSPSETLENGT